MVAGDSLIKASGLMMPDRLRKYAPDVRRYTLLHAAARFPGDLKKTAKTALGVIPRRIIPPKAPFSIGA
jgi:hypothetical protein